MPSRNTVASGARTCVLVKARASNERRVPRGCRGHGARHAATPPAGPPRCPARAPAPRTDSVAIAGVGRERACTSMPMPPRPQPAGLAVRPAGKRRGSAGARQQRICRPGPYARLTQQRNARGLREPARCYGRLTHRPAA